MEKKLKHLDYIQDAIKRMAGNSFLLRGWSITLIIATVSLANHTQNPIYLFISLMIVVVFWLLDSFYLWQERKFRCLYDEVRVKQESSIDFSMKLPGEHSDHCNKCRWIAAMHSPVFLIFYGLALLLLIVSLAVIHVDVTDALI